jgi:hypothetical protein
LRVEAKTAPALASATPEHPWLAFRWRQNAALVIRLRSAARQFG